MDFLGSQNGMRKLDKLDLNHLNHLTQSPEQCIFIIKTFLNTLVIVVQMLPQNLLTSKLKPLEHRSEVLEISLSFYSVYLLFLAD